MRLLIGSAACALVLAGCQTTSIPKGEQVRLEDLIRQVKSDIGQYNAYAEQNAGAVPGNDACGSKIDLRIKSVTVSVTTITKESGGGSIGAEIAPSAILTVGASAAGGRSLQNSQVLTFTLVPVASPSGPVPSQKSQLYSALRDLRESLLRASDTTPCLGFPASDQENSLEFGFTASRNTTVGGSINLFIFAIGAERSSERTAAHTITIGFEGKGQALQ